MSSSRGAPYWIERLQLKPHPEGGYYAEVYRSEGVIPEPALPARYGGRRVFSTSIYFMLCGGQVSAWHRLKSDEIWHFYAGAPVMIYTINSQGGLTEGVLGPDGSGRGVFQFVVKAGEWMSSILTEDADFALLGCTVAPGFEFQDFELAKLDDLEREYPKHQWLFAKFRG